MAQSTVKNNSYRSGHSSTPQWMVFWVKVLLVLILLLLLPKLVDGGANKNRKKIRKLVQKIQSHCRDHVCFSGRLEESMNCIHFCVSPACYESVYGDMPLEDGEMDFVRDAAYETCLQKEFSIRQKRMGATK
jgi:hypothetical protein